MSELSTKPYLLRAIHEWCTDSGYTPYIAVSVDERTLVPADFVRSGEIVLNISLSATNRLSIGNELIEFQARFGGTAQDLSIPVDNVSAIYARENGHGMAFEVTRGAVPGMAESEGDAGDDPSGADAGAERPAKKPTKPRPSLAAVPKSEPAAEGHDQAADESPDSPDSGDDNTQDSAVVPVADPSPAQAADSAADTPGEEDAPSGDGGDSPEKKPPRKRRGKPKLTRVK